MHFLFNFDLRFDSVVFSLSRFCLAVGRSLDAVKKNENNQLFFGSVEHTSLRVIREINEYQKRIRLAKHTILSHCICHTKSSPTIGDHVHINYAEMWNLCLRCGISPQPTTRMEWKNAFFDLKSRRRRRWWWRWRWTRLAAGILPYLQKNLIQLRRPAETNIKRYAERKLLFAKLTWLGQTKQFFFLHVNRRQLAIAESVCLRVHYNYSVSVRRAIRARQFSLDAIQLRIEKQSPIRTFEKPNDFRVSVFIAWGGKTRFRQIVTDRKAEMSRKTKSTINLCMNSISEGWNDVNALHAHRRSDRRNVNRRKRSMTTC